MSERSRHRRDPLPPLVLPPWIGESGGRRALFVDGVVQSVDPDDAASGYWQAMVPEQPPASALLLGLGGGTVAHLLVRRFGPLPITGIDTSPEIIAVAREAFALAELPLTIVQADALQYVHHTAERFGYVAVDLYRGNRLARGVLALPFLRAVAARLLPGGTLAFNLFADSYLEGRLPRLERVFEQLRLEVVGANAIFHGRPRRPQR